MCFVWLRRRDSLFAAYGCPAAVPCAAAANFEFRNGRLRQVPVVAGGPVAIAGRRGAFTAFAVHANPPSLPREEALEAIGRNVGRLPQVFTPCEIGL